MTKKLVPLIESHRSSMNDFSGGRGKSWNAYGGGLNSDMTSQTEVNKADPWRSFGSSMNAISFGFVATAILISMFLIMAIFEHLFRPNNGDQMESRQMQKLGTSPEVQTTSDFSVVMPGQHYPTFIAQPAPLASCQREGVRWPSHRQP